MTAMMPLRIDTPGPIIQELPDTDHLSGAAGNGVIKRLENRIDKQALASSSTSALALTDKPADVPAPALAPSSASALALVDEPKATAQDLLPVGRRKWSRRTELRYQVELERVHCWDHKLPTSF